MNDLRITDKKYHRTFKAEKITALANIMKARGGNTHLNSMSVCTDKCMKDEMSCLSA